MFKKLICIKGLTGCAKKRRLKDHGIKIVFSGLLFFLTAPVLAQTRFLDSSLETVRTRDSAAFVQTTKILGKTKTETIKFLNGKVYQLNTSVYPSRDFNGVKKQWYANGQLRHERHLKNSRIDGALHSFYENGKPKRDEIYKDGVYVSGMQYDSLGRHIPHDDFEQPPSFVGGMNTLLLFVNTRVVYPEEAKRAGLEDRVLITFTIDRTGKPVHFRVTQSKSPLLAWAALNAVRELPDFQSSALRDGEPVKTDYTLPVVFRLK